jgi:hypothetical protein
MSNIKIADLKPLQISENSVQEIKEINKIVGGCNCVMTSVGLWFCA